jgi:ubiquinone/menaquinone biosynthesis C-methylase UbiE
MADVINRSAQAAARFDTMMRGLEERYFPDARTWVCRRAVGSTLEIAIGTGLNLRHYPDSVELTAIDSNPAAVEFAVKRAHGLGRALHIEIADALALPYPEEHFDSVVCTFALCEVRQVPPALAEFARVLRPDGRLLLADHIAATNPLIWLGQRLLEAATIPISGEHFTRRPQQDLAAAGFQVVDSHRRTHGAIEYVHARKIG